MSCTAKGKQPASASMQNLRDFPHPLARPLALCFVFEPADTQFIAATCLELGFTLDTALATPSEPLLAVIRLQWWIDAIQDTAPAHAPETRRVPMRPLSGGGEIPMMLMGGDDFDEETKEALCTRSQEEVRKAPHKFAKNPAEAS